MWSSEIFLNKELKKHGVDRVVFDDLLNDYNDTIKNKLFENLKQLEESHRDIQTRKKRIDQSKKEANGMRSKKHNEIIKRNEIRSKLNKESCPEYELNHLKVIEEIHGKLIEGCDEYMNKISFHDMKVDRKYIRIHEERVEALTQLLRNLIEDVIKGIPLERVM